MRKALLMVLALLPALVSAQSSVNYYPGDIDPTRIYKVRVELTASDLMALSGETKVVVPGVPGYIAVSYSSQWDRLAGTAYTLNGVTELVLRWPGVTTYSVSRVTATGFMDTAGPDTRLYCYGPVVGGPSVVLPSVGQPVVAARVGGTDLSGGTGSVVVTLWYRLFKVPQ